VGAEGSGKGLEGASTHFASIKNMFLSRILDQNKPKMRYFLEKVEIRRRALPPRLPPVAGNPPRTPALLFSSSVTVFPSAFLALNAFNRCRKLEDRKKITSPPGRRNLTK